MIISNIRRLYAFKIEVELGCSLASEWGMGVCL